MNRYIVYVKPADEDHPAFGRVYGIYQSEAKADWFARKINEKVDKADRDDSGYAYVLPIRKPVVVEGRRLALHGRDAVA